VFRGTVPSSWTNWGTDFDITLIQPKDPEDPCSGMEDIVKNAEINDPT